jgi:plastocyanin
MRKMRSLLFSFLFMILIIPGCSDNGTDPGGGDPPANEIWIQNNTFRPASITIVAGTTLTWVNKDNVTHTVTSGSGSPSGVFDSGNLARDQSFSFTFETTDTYNYYCKLHPNMTGSVTVQ